MPLQPLPANYENPMADNNYGPLFEQYKVTYGKRLEFVQANLYDTVNYPSVARPLNLPVFDGVRNITQNRVICNMPGNTLPDRQGFLVMALQFIPGLEPGVSNAGTIDSFQPGNALDIFRLAFNGIFEMKLYEKTYAQVPLIMMPAACGVEAFFTSALTAVIQSANNGIPDARNLYTMEEPVFIPPLVQIQAQMIWDRPLILSAINPPLKINMGGLMVRPVQ